MWLVVIVANCYITIETLYPQN